MAVIDREPTDAEMREWEAWVRSRPAGVQAAAQRFVPWRLYRMRSSGQRVVVVGYGLDPDGRADLIVDVLYRFNTLFEQRRLHDVALDDLVECDLPGPGEAVGPVEVLVLDEMVAGGRRPN